MSASADGDVVARMYECFQRIQDAANKEDERDSFEFIIAGAGGDPRAQALAVQFLPKLARFFPGSLSDRAFEAQLQLLNTPAQRPAALAGFVELAQSANGEAVPFQRAVATLAQLLGSPDAREVQLVHRQFARLFQLDAGLTLAGLLQLVLHDAGPTRRTALAYFLEHLPAHRASLRANERSQAELAAALKLVLSDPGGAVSVLEPAPGLARQAHRRFRRGAWDGEGSEFRIVFQILVGLPSFRQSPDYATECGRICVARAGIEGPPAPLEAADEGLLRVTVPWAALLAPTTRLQRDPTAQQPFLDWFREHAAPGWTQVSAGGRLGLAQCLGRAVSHFSGGLSAAETLFETLVKLFAAEVPLPDAEAGADAERAAAEAAAAKVGGRPIMAAAGAQELEEQASVAAAPEQPDQKSSEPELEEEPAALVEAGGINLSAAQLLLVNLHRLAGRCSEARKKALCGLWTPAGQPSDYKDLDAAAARRQEFQARLRRLQALAKPILGHAKQALAALAARSKAPVAAAAGQQSPEQARQLQAKRNRVTRALGLAQDILQATEPLLHAAKPHFVADIGRQGPPKQPQAKLPQAKQLQQQQQQQQQPKQPLKQQPKQAGKRKQDALAQPQPAQPPAQAPNKRPAKRQRLAAQQQQQQPAKRQAGGQRPKRSTGAQKPSIKAGTPQQQPPKAKKRGGRK